MLPLMVAQHLLSCRLHIYIFLGPDTYTHTHTHTADTNTCVYTNTCSAWGHKHKQGTQPPETPLFPVWVCVPMLSMCVYTRMCLHRTCLCVCVCVCVCVQTRADVEMKTKYKNTLTNSTLLLCLFGPGRGVTCSEDSPRTNQMGWVFETTGCRALSLWAHGPFCGNVDVATAGLGW